jgi:hypothetical protein
LMSLIVTSDYAIEHVAPPALPLPGDQYSRAYQDQLNNVLRLYFNRLNSILGQLMATDTSIPISFPPTALDAFGRQRVSQPYTLFDSQQRYAADNQFDTTAILGATTTYLPNESSVQMSVSNLIDSEAVRQSFRSMSYQPGKGLLVLATFAMNTPVAGIRQRVGYFNTQNGVFFQASGTTLSMVMRSSSLPTPGVASDIRTIPQSQWNGDKLDGTGPSGITLDPSKTQIFWCDFEWLGVGSVRTGFVINGQYITCHTFNNANDIGSVYMTTAILPVRYEIKNLGGGPAASMKQICSTVISEGGYEQYSPSHLARRTTKLTNIQLAFKPVVSIRLSSSALGAVVVPGRMQVLPIASQSYEVGLFFNSTLTGASWAAIDTDANVQFDTSATAMTGGTLVQTDYVTASGSGGQQPLVDPSGYNWALQLGVSLAGASDVITLAIRTVDSATPQGECYGTIAFWDLTQ